MLALENCPTFVELVALSVWQSMQSVEGGQLLTSLGSLLLIVYNLRRGALYGGRVLAIALLAGTAIVLWSVVIYTATRLDWESVATLECQQAPSARPVYAAPHREVDGRSSQQDRSRQVGQTPRTLPKGVAHD